MSWRFSGSGGAHNRHNCTSHKHPRCTQLSCQARVFNCSTVSPGSIRHHGEPTSHLEPQSHPLAVGLPSRYFEGLSQDPGPTHTTFARTLALRLYRQEKKKTRRTRPLACKKHRGILSAARADEEAKCWWPRESADKRWKLCSWQLWWATHVMCTGTRGACGMPEGINRSHAALLTNAMRIGDRKEI